LSRTALYTINGVEHELTDELLIFLKEKTLAEMQGREIPPFPSINVLEAHKENLKDVLYTGIIMKVNLYKAHS